jgi:transcriptional regulator with XRE-family HTH domain
MESTTIGSALRSRRKSLNIDQARAAAIIGMSRTTFSSYERDLQRPSAEVLTPLAGFLDVTIEEMLTLYGATCIEAIRSQLERLVTSSQDVALAAPTVEEGGAIDESDGIEESSPERTSVSIFANELSHGTSPSPVSEEPSGITARATRVIDAEPRDEVLARAENGKKKKKKKKKH